MATKKAVDTGDKPVSTPRTPKPEPSTVFAIGLNQHLAGEVSDELRKAVKANGEAWAVPTYHLNQVTRQTLVVWEYVDYDSLIPGPQPGEMRLVKLV